MKKYKKLAFTFSLLSLGGLFGGFVILKATRGQAFYLEDVIVIWLFSSVPVVVLWIYTRLFD